MKKNIGIRRGVNLGGWLSQCDYSAERLNHFIQAENIAQIASWQVDHVRIPVDYNVLEDDRGGYDAPGWERLDWALSECGKYGLKVIIDLHKTAGFSFDAQEREGGFFDNGKYQERFYCLWEEIARRYGEKSEQVMFELLVGSYHNNSAPAVKDLAPPADEKVVYNFHCYDPFIYTHQGAKWVKELADSPFVPFEESGATEEMFEARFAPAVEAAEKYGAPLYCGEYGVIDKVPAEDAIKWYRVINAVFEKHGIARAAWSYKQMDFGLSDPYWDGVRDELVKLL